MELPENEEPIKIKNCISSARSNSELFKRFSKSLMANIKNEVDMLLLFSSTDPVARVETSIGTASNPGIFLIIGLTYLEEKYKDNHHRCDIEFSFMEFRDGQLFDLLCNTG